MRYSYKAPKKLDSKAFEASKPSTKSSRKLTTYHLIGEHEHRFEGKFALAVVEEVLERGSQQVDHHNVVVALYSEPVHVRDANCKSKTQQAGQSAAQDE